MTLLTLKEICLENKNGIINLDYCIEPNQYYVFYSNDKKILNQLASALIYPEEIKLGKIKYHSMNICTFNSDEYRKSIISVIDNSNNFIDYLSSVEFLSLFSNENTNVLGILKSLKFPLENYNSKISKLDQKCIDCLIIAKMFLKKSEIIIIDRFIDYMENEDQKRIFINKIIEISSVNNIAVIILSTISSWNNDIFNILYI